METRPAVARRALVVGPPGAGKTWVATRLASAYEIPHVELDSLKLKPNRGLATADEYETAVRLLVESGSWLLDGNWSDDPLAAEAWHAADLVVWLDYSRPVVMRQVALRSIRRLISGEDYYGWTESARDWFSPTHQLRWSWRMVDGYSRRYSSMTTRLASDKYVRLRTRSDAEQFVSNQPRPDPS
jgi:adenylate kinase family enzyme